MDMVVDADAASGVPGASFGEAPVQGRKLAEGMGVAVARRTVFRPEDKEDWGRVADRVAEGNVAVLGDLLEPRDYIEQARLRNAIAAGALLTSGRHLQHGDKNQPSKNLELFTNCSTSCTSFAAFYLLLNGSGVGRSYDDELIVVDFGKAPDVLVFLDSKHPDFPHSAEAKHQFAVDMGWVPYSQYNFDAAQDARAAELLDTVLLSDISKAPKDAQIIRVPDSREGWAKTIEIIESMAFEGHPEKTVVFDLSDVRPFGAPIAGMQNRPASGPISLARALVNIQLGVIAPARARDPSSGQMQPFEQAVRLDHFLSVEVQCGGARRAARMATKSWRDPGILRFIALKSEGGLWSANNSVMVDREFWDRVKSGDKSDPVTAHACAVFDEVSRCSYINGEPGYINGDMLEDHRTGFAWEKPVYEDGRDFRGNKYQADQSKGLLAAVSKAAKTSKFPATVNPCSEIVLHVTGGYCVIADYAPLLACPVPFEDVMPGYPSEDVAREWDARVADTVRLGVRFLIRANRMNALYGCEVERTNRIGIGPTGLHEYAWVRFGLGFRDLLNPKVSEEFWHAMDKLSDIAKQEAIAYSAELGMNSSVTITTSKPSGSVSKLFGITEGVHLPARRQYLRWVQFRGGKDSQGNWLPSSDKLLAEHEANGYPVRELRTFPGVAIVGFPTEPLIVGLGMGDNLVTASEATPAEQYEWLKLLETNWIGAERGNQISYTLKLYTDKMGVDAYRDLVLRQQPQVRCCSILPSKPDHELGYEYLPEEEVTAERFQAIQARIHGGRNDEEVDMAHLQCVGGVCPI